MKSKPISRRSLASLAGRASALVAAATGAKILGDGGLIGAGSPEALARLRRALVDGDGRAFAAADAFGVSPHPIFILTVQAKWDSSGWLSRPNPRAVGVAGNPLAEASSAFSSLGLTKMFGDHVASLEGKVGIAVVPVTTTTGNHVYDGLRLTMSTTGCLPAYVATETGSLMSLHFSSVGAADAATACFGKGGTQLISYPTMDSAVSSLTNALEPLQSLPGSASAVLAQLNDRVTRDTQFRKGLEDLAARLAAAKDPLAAARAAGNGPTRNLTAVTQMDPAALLPLNPLVPQIMAAQSLIDLGLIHAVTLSIANSDPNAGGDHAGRGGSNVAFGPKSPNEVKSCVGQALVEIFRRYPGAIVSITSDGGRGADGGDAQNFEGFIAGPADLVKTVFIGADSRSDSTQFGSTPQPIMVSSGQAVVPSQAHLMSTVARAAGIEFGAAPYITGMLVSG